MGYLSEELDAKHTVIHTMYLVLMACMQSGYQESYLTLCRDLLRTLQVHPYYYYCYYYDHITHQYIDVVAYLLMTSTL